MITTDGKGGGCGERSSSQTEAPRAGSSASSEAPRYNQKRMGSLSSASRDTQAVGSCSAVNHWLTSADLPEPAGAESRVSLPRAPWVRSEEHTSELQSPY